jgi:chromosome partitioning protein
MTKIISISNQAGGAGKTTIAYNLGGVLAELGKKTLLIDMDQQGDLSAGFFDEVDELPVTIHDVLINARPMADVIHPTAFENLFVVPANYKIKALDKALAHEDDADYLLSEALETISADAFDFILIDCPPSLQVATRMALIASDAVIVPFEPDKKYVRGTVKVVDLIQKLRRRIKPDLKFEGIILNRVQKTNLSSSYIQAVTEKYGDGLIFKTIVKSSTRYRETFTNQQPINVYKRNSIYHQTFLNLANEVINHA